MPSLIDLIRKQNEIATQRNHHLSALISLKKDQLSQLLEIREALDKNTKEVLESTAVNTKLLLDNLNTLSVSTKITGVEKNLEKVCSPSFFFVNIIHYNW